MQKSKKHHMLSIKIILFSIIKYFWAFFNQKRLILADVERKNICTNLSDQLQGGGKDELSKESKKGDCVFLVIQFVNCPVIFVKLYVLQLQTSSNSIQHRFSKEGVQI